MSATPSTILTDEHFALFKNSQDSAKQIQTEIDLARQAGFPVDKLQERLNTFLENSKKIKQVYYPGRS